MTIAVETKIFRGNGSPDEPIVPGNAGRPRQAWPTGRGGPASIVRSRRGTRGATSAAVFLVLLIAAQGAAAQSLLDRPPNMSGTWVGLAGTVYFNFMHRFAVSDPPSRKVQNTPTFLISAGLPANLMVGARYASNSALVTGEFNEWEYFGRYGPLAQQSGAPLDLTAHAGYNNAAQSADFELTVARRVGPLRLLAAGRGFSNFANRDEAKWAVAGGATLRLIEFVALAGDVATVIDGADDDDVAWGAGVHIQIPYTPHSLSLHYSNAHTTTLQGASVGGPDGRWGFEFTVPFTLSRYFGGRPATVAADPADAPAGVTGAGGELVVTMTNQLAFAPDTLRVAAGETVVWRNTSEVVHTVTFDPARAVNPTNVALPAGAEPFDSGDMAPGAEFRHTFTMPGEYRYICIPHELAGRMLGVVIVEQP